jgi:hypothetical protein
MLSTGTLFAGVWRAGTDPYYLWVSDWNNFKKKWEELSEENLRLVDLERYFDGNNIKYAARAEVI